MNSSLKRAVDVALGARAVVADDVVDERVVEDPEVLERVDQPADVVVGVLEEAGVDLHLAGEHRLAGRRASSSQAGISSGRAVSSASAGIDAELLLAGEGLLAQLVPALVELALVLRRPLRRARGAARASRRARSR